MLSISISFQQLDRLDESLPGGGIQRGSRPSGLWRLPAPAAGWAYLEEVFIEGLVLLDSGECLLQQLDESLPGEGIHRGSRPSGLWRVPAPATGWAYLEEVFIEGLVLLDSGECLLQQLDKSSGLGHLHYFINLLLKNATIPVIMYGTKVQKSNTKFQFKYPCFRINTFVTPSYRCNSSFNFFP